MTEESYSVTLSVILHVLFLALLIYYTHIVLQHNILSNAVQKTQLRVTLVRQFATEHPNSKQSIFSQSQTAPINNTNYTNNDDNVSAIKPISAKSIAAIKPTIQSTGVIKPISAKPIAAKQAKLARSTVLPLNDLLDNHSTVHAAASTTADIDSLTDNAVDINATYADAVIAAVRPLLLVPEHVVKTAIAIVELHLNPDLSIAKIIMLKSSNNSEYDDNINKALIMLGNFPPLPTGSHYSDYRILRLTFRP